MRTIVKRLTLCLTLWAGAAVLVGVAAVADTIAAGIAAGRCHG